MAVDFVGRRFNIQYCNRMHDITDRDSSMPSAEPFVIAKGDQEVRLHPRMANRHGMVAGATGTGKTVSLQTLAEHFSGIGVPVFMADVKGDLSGVSRAGAATPKIQERIAMLGLAEFAFSAHPVAFWDLFGEQGHPVRATISEMGPLLLARMLELNDTQSGVLNIVFRAADDAGLLLLDLKDLRATLAYAGDNAKKFRTTYGNISAASIGAIQRGLLQLEEQGGAAFFGEPSLDLDDFLRTDPQGRGVINILAADKLLRSPALYSTFLLWLLSELFERLPEVGDAEKPKLVFFFDEAHLLFDDAPRVLLDKIEQVVRLIRSKGIGVFFISQNPLDVPDIILGQLGNRIQHALRAYTPRDQKAVKAAATTFRANPKLEVETAITELGVGEALVSMLDEKGIPGIVERAFILPPTGAIGPVPPDQRAAAIRQSALYGRYEKAIDRDSAYEILDKRRAAAEAPPQEEADRIPVPRPAEEIPSPDSRRAPARRSDTIVEAMARSAARAVGSSLGRQIVRGVLGSIFGGR